MKNLTCKRTLSALLAVVMVVSMFGFTNMTATAWTGSTALESDGRPNASADAASANVQFLVPETIYLDPAGENYTYFVDALDAGTPDANPMRTSGRIYFHADVPVSGLVIARSDARTTFGSGAGQTSTLSTTFSDTGTARAGDLIEWTATYSLGGNTYTSYAYTYIYRPSPDVVGQAFSAAVQPNGASTKLQKGVVSALTGFHAADSTYKGNRTWGGSTAVANPQTVETNPIGTLGWGLKNASTPDSVLTAATAGGIFFESFSTAEERICEQDTATVSTGALTVDRSRYTNLNQIPYLQAVHYNYYNTWDSDSFARYAYGVTTDASLSAVVNYTNYAVSDRFANDGATAQSYYSSAKINCALTKSTPSSFYLWSRICSNGTYTDAGNYNVLQVNSAARLHVTLVDKADLRSAYRLACALAVEKVNGYAGFSDFKTKLSAAGSVLGNPTATQTQINTAKTELDSAYSTLKSQLTRVSAVYRVPTVTFYVPETIYLDPADGKTLRYYIDRDNAVNGALSTESGKTFGNIYFKCNDTTAKITELTVSSDIGFFEAPKLDATQSSSNILSTSTTGGILSAQIASGATTQLTWKVIYTTSTGSFTATAYSTLYATKIGASSLIAASAQSGYNTNWHTAGNIMVSSWIAGAHSANFNQATPDSFSGTASGSEGDGRGSYKGRVFESTTVPVASEDNVDKVFEGGTGGSGYFAKDSSVNWTGGAGWLHVDTSRYTNLNQIPYLQFGLDDNYERTDSNNTKDNVGGLYYTRQGSTEVNVGSWNNSGNGNSGVRLFTGKKFDTPVSETGNFWISVRAWGQKKTDSVCDAQATSYLYVDQMSKAALRTKLNEEAGKRQSSWYTDDTRSAYQSALKNAYNVLGNPAVSASDVTSAINRLQTAITGLTPMTGSLSAKHFSDTPNTVNNRYNLLGTDAAKEYHFGDTVTAGANYYPGYTFSGTFGGFDVEKWKVVDGFSEQGISAISVDATTNSVTVTGTAADSYTRFAMGSGYSADDYYFVPCTPNTPYTLRYTGSGTDGALYIFYMDADFNYIGRTSKSGLGEQTLSATTHAKARYMQFRFGVGVGTKTYANIRLVGGLAQSAEFIDVPNTVYHLYYTPNSYTVTYRPEGGTFNGTTASTTDTVLYDDAYTVGKIGERTAKTQQDAPIRKGYTFVGWHCDATDTVVANGASLGTWKFDRDVTYTAVWTANTYTVHFDGDGATSGSMDDQTFYFNTPQALSNNKFQRTGFSFTGWALIRGSSPDFQNGEKIFNLAQTNDEVITLYACWLVNSYTLKVDPNSGTMAEKSVSYNHNDVPQKNDVAFTSPSSFEADYSTSASIKSPTRIGYTFSGWTKVGNTTAYDVPTFGAPNGSGTTRDLTKTVAPDNSYTNYVWNVGSSAVSSDSWCRVAFDTYSVQANETVTISGYIRINRNSQIGVNLYHGAKSNDYANGLAGFNYTDGQWKYFRISRTFVEASDTAVFEICTGNGNGKSGTVVDFDVKGITIHRGSPASASVRMADSDVTLTAQWSPLPVAVQFHANGGNGEMSSFIAAYNESVTLQANTFKQPGYSFLGWARTADGDVAFGDGATVSCSELQSNPAQDGSAVVDLYAVWEPIIFTVRYNLGGADITVPDGAVALEGASVKLGTVTDQVVTIDGKHYLFDGWATAKDSSTPDYAGGASFAVTENDLDALDIDRSGTTPVINLYAVWESADFIIRYDFGETTLTLPDDSAYLDGAPITLGAVMSSPVQLGGKNVLFNGWAVSKDSQSADYEAGESFVVAKDNIASLDVDRSGATPVITLYAVWKNADYTISYNLGGADISLPDTPIVMNGTVVRLAAVPTSAAKIGDNYYHFDGWAISENGEVSLQNKGTIFLNTGNVASFDLDGTVIRLYAVWTQLDTTAYIDSANSKAVIDSESGFVYGLKIGVTEEEIANEYIQIVGSAHLEFEYLGYVGTGTVVRLVSDITGEVLEAYTVVIFGDLNGDGQVNNQDVLAAKAFAGCTVEYEMTDAEAFAADLFEDGNINNADISLLKAMQDGSILLDQATREQSIPV